MSKLFILLILTFFPVSQNAYAETIYVGEHRLKVQIAKTQEEQEKGLMFKKKLSEEEGMLFVFSEEKIAGFWMKNTTIPLSIGFFNSKKRLFEIIDMEPANQIELNPPVYQSKDPALYALEVNKGWFKRKKIKIGTKLKINE